MLYEQARREVAERTPPLTRSEKWRLFLLFLGFLLGIG